MRIFSCERFDLGEREKNDKCRGNEGCLVVLKPVCHGRTRACAVNQEQINQSINFGQDASEVVSFDSHDYRDHGS